MPGVELRMPTPGAARSTVLSPKFEKLASWSLRSDAATESTFATS